MIIAENVSKKFMDSDREIWPVNKLSINVESGRFFSIVGRSGSGKSTLLKILGGLLEPTDGKVVIDGKDIYSLSRNEIADYRNQVIGFVFQDYFLEEMYTVYQNVEIALMIAGVDKKDRAQRVEAALEAVELGDKKSSLVKNLSGGEKQRVSIARAIVNNASIIFADEPCGNLDWENSQNVMRLLRKQCDAGKTVVLITHSLDDAKLTDEIITLKDGSIIEHEKLR
ncbi:MAG: ABC transporter ATP-binding protein [Lachnospiraceae bacterium]|nr:ABC transporter ATP-binding protein [Lachnospiraceae bacterium]